MNTPSVLRISFHGKMAAIQRQGVAGVVFSTIMQHDIAGGLETYYLDKMIHGPGDLAEGWGLDGLYCTVLSRKASPRAVPTHGPSS